MRTDQLLIGSTDIPVSVVVSIILVIISATFIIINRIRANRLGIPYPQAVIESMVVADESDSTESAATDSKVVDEAVLEPDDVVEQASSKDLLAKDESADEKESTDTDDSDEIK